MGAKNKFKPKSVSSATPWKEEVTEDGEGQQKISGTSKGIKKSLFNRKSG
jgi:hypothetical protein